MNKQIEALKMAIEALSQDEGWFEPEAAIKACKEALEQELPEDAELESYKQGYEQGKFDALMDAELTKSEYKFDHPDYGELTQIPEQPAQEPVAWNEEEFNAIAYAYRSCPVHEVKMVSERYQDLVDYVLSITHPAPSWQGLSDDEIFELHHKWIINSGNKDTQYDFARAIEQALKEKNGR